MITRVIEIDNRKITVYDYSQDRYISTHTGKELLAISFQCNIRGDDNNQWFLNLLGLDKIGVKLSLDDESSKYFRLNEKSCSYSDRDDGQPIIYSHSVILKEMEMFDVKKIRIEDLVIEPYQYSEKDDDGQIVITFKCAINDDIRNALIALLYGHHIGGQQIRLDVIREGIDEHPRAMRFGRISWSQQDGELVYKYKIILVDFDEKEHRPQLFADPIMVENIGAMFTKRRMISEILVQKLIEKGIISKEDINIDLNDSAEWMKFSNMHHDLSLVENIDKE